MPRGGFQGKDDLGSLSLGKYPSRKGEGGEAWLGWPLWPPAVPRKHGDLWLLELKYACVYRTLVLEYSQQSGFK